MNDKDTQLLAEAYSKIKESSDTEFNDALSASVVQQIAQVPQKARQIAKDQGITNEINWGNVSETAWEIYDLIFSPLVKNSDYEEVKYMMNNYGLDTSEFFE